MGDQRMGAASACAHQSEVIETGCCSQGSIRRERWSELNTDQSGFITTTNDETRKRGGQAGDKERKGGAERAGLARVCAVACVRTL